METNLKEQLRVQDQVFTFSLCRKSQTMGVVPVDHWWMKVTELYCQRQQRQRKGDNYEAVLDCFWALCRQTGSDSEPDVQESYLLARLLPLTRSQGSRRIFADARLDSASRARTRSRQQRVEELDGLLQGSRAESLDWVQFRDRTGDLLGPPQLTEEAIAEYQRLCGQLLKPVCAILGEDEPTALQQLYGHWDRCMRLIARRSGQALQKQVLDVLSYESRAALHRCYSAVWSELLPQLECRYQLSEASLRFLRFWHLEQCSKAAEGDHSYFHPFHGHVFALHPASGAFLRTATGQEMIGDWLAKPEDEPALGRLLHGLYVAAHHYDLRRDDQVQQRKKQPSGLGDYGLAELEESLTARRARRKNRRR